MDEDDRLLQDDHDKRDHVTKQVKRTAMIHVLLVDPEVHMIEGRDQKQNEADDEQIIADPKKEGLFPEFPFRDEQIGEIVGQKERDEQNEKIAHPVTGANHKVTETGRIAVEFIREYIDKKEKHRLRFHVGENMFGAGGKGSG